MSGVTTYTLLDVAKDVGYAAGDLVDMIATVEGGALEDPAIRALLRSINAAANEIARFDGLRLTNTSQTFSTVADYTDGTVAVTNGSTTVTGTDTTFTAAMVGRAFATRADDTTYRVASFTSATSIEIDVAYIGDTSSGQTYVIAQDRYEAASNVKEIREAIIGGDAARPLDILTYSEILHHRGDWAWTSRANAPGFPRAISRDAVRSDDDNFYYVVDPFPDDIYKVDLLVDLWPNRLRLDNDPLPVEDGNYEILVSGAHARLRSIHGDREDRMAFQEWKRTELRDFLATDEQKTDRSARIVPDDVMRSRPAYGYGRPDWKDR